MKAFAIPYRLLTVLAFGASAITGVSQTPISIPGLYNTGVDNSGHVLPPLSLEQHYHMSGPAGSTVYVVTPVNNPPFGQWAAAPAGSGWIGPNSTTNVFSPDPIGNYVYTLRFDLTGFNPGLVRIAGLWMTDNDAQLYLNGAYTGFSKSGIGYSHTDPFLLSSGFLAGTNTLEFRVLNEIAVGPNPTGLVVSGLSASLVPEPCSYLLAFLGLSVLLARKGSRP